ncbi:hypothetical protein AXF42_Ash009535 [Apostasia shenzhenica]|uniref:Senescence regulator n=1 Tax=Apostasia shenzhenica TaxID=1088818 RepID=A0A2I0B930_9ASPA|nr:hypothetical protein AXF42_Ash009535 [Apostasia shenzhenica]
MNSFGFNSSSGNGRLLGLLSRPEFPEEAALAAAATGGGEELNETEVFWSDTLSPELNQRFPHHPCIMASSAPNPSPGPSFSCSGIKRLSERNSGVLVALPEEEKKRNLIQRKNLSSTSHVSGVSPPLPSLSSSRMIPAVLKPKGDYTLSVPGGTIYHQSAPVNVPVRIPRARRTFRDLDGDGIGNEYGEEEEEMLPPHEHVARAAAKESPWTTFSMLEGAGRTLKGRDLRKVRNAVWRQTGFLD